MGLSILYGRAGSGKHRRFMEEIRDAVSQNTPKPVLLIVPEQFSYRTERSLTEALGVTGQTGAEVLTFSRLARRIFQLTENMTENSITPAGKSMLVYKVLADNQSKLELYGSACERHGFADRVAGLISEFKRYGVEPQAFMEKAKQTESGIFGAKLRDIALVYEAFCKQTEEGYTDPDDNLYRAAAALLRSDYLDGADIWIAEFSDFLPHHYALLEVLLKKAKRVRVSLCCDMERDGEGTFAPTAKTFARLEALARTCGVAVGEHTYLTGAASYKTPELTHLEAALTDYGFAAYRHKTENLRLFEAATPYSELSAVAAEVVRLCREEGYRRREIAIVCANYESYAYMAEVLLPRYEIRFFADQRISADTHPVALAVLAMFEIFADSWSYESVFKYLKTGYSDLTPEEVDLLENYVLAAGIRGKAWRDEACWRYKIQPSFGEEGDSEALQMIDTLRRKVAKPLLAFREKMGRSRTIEQMCEGLFELLEEQRIREKMQFMADKLAEAGKPELANQYKRTWNILLELMDQMVALMGGDEIGFERFKNLLAAGLGKYNVGTIPQSVDAVALCDTERARTLAVRAMFIVGANNGFLPGTQAGEGILSDADRLALQEGGITLAPTQRSKAFDGPFLVYQVLNVPTEKLQISYAMADSEGRSLLPSQTISHIRRIFPNLTIGDDLDSEKENIHTAVCSPDATFDRAAVMLRREQDGETIHPAWNAVFEWYKHSPRYGDAYTRLCTALSYTNRAHPLDKGIVKSLYKDTLYSSVSRLESFAKCPYSYFVRFALKAKERKILKLEAPDVGILMHRVLEEFCRGVESSGLGFRGVDYAYCAHSVGQITEDLLSALFSGTTLGGKRFEFIANRLKQNLIWCAWVLTLHIQAGQFEIAGTEVVFGVDGALAPVELELPSYGKLSLSGVIDRVDVLETPQGAYYRIIDYKSGSKKFNLDGVYNGLDLQLMVYLDAALSQRKDAKPAGTLFYRISEPFVRADAPTEAEELKVALQNQMRLDGLVLADERVLSAMGLVTDDGAQILPVGIKKDGGFLKTSSVATGQQFELLSRYVRDCLKELGTRILSGHIDITPSKYRNSSPCQYCNFFNICNFDPSEEGNGYHRLPSCKPEEIWKELDQRYGDEKSE